MPAYNNRVTKESIVPSVIFEDDTVQMSTNFGTFTLPSNVLTQKIYESHEHPYTLEFDSRSAVLSGIISPEGTTLYRIDDSAVRQIATSASYLSRLSKDGQTVPLAEALETMMDSIDPVLIDRLKNLPQEYLNEYYVYEVKVSYLASNGGENLIFDPTPSEKAHALALSMMENGVYPPLIQKTY